MVHLNAISSVLPPCAVSSDETAAFLCGYVADHARPRLRRVLAASGNRQRYSVLPLAELARLRGTGERSDLYRKHAELLANQALTALVERDVLLPEAISTIISVSSTGWAAPSLETRLVRRFGIDPRCRRIPLTALGCGGGVAALSLAAETVRRDPRARVLVVSVELPSLQMQLAEPSLHELMSAAHFGDGAAAAIVSADDHGPEVVGTESVLLPETEEGGRIVPSETGLRLLASGTLPRLVRARVRELVERCAGGCGVDGRRLEFVVAHPRGAEVLEAVGAGLSLDRSALAAGFAAWEETGNMVSASIYRAFGHLARTHAPAEGAVGMALAFGTGVACEMAVLRWRSAPTLVGM